MVILKTIFFFIMNANVIQFSNKNTNKVEVNSTHVRILSEIFPSVQKHDIS